MERQEDDEGYLELSGKARLIAVILKPVILTMLVVIWVIRTLMPENGAGGGGGGMAAPAIATMAYHEESGDSALQKLGGSALNALIFIIFITIMTFVFVFLIKYRCMKIIYCWLTFSVVSLLGALGGVMFYKLLQAYNLGIDYITFSLLLWNYAIVGLVSIFGPESPEQVTHGYLVCVSVFLAYIFNNLPEWTCWMLLGFLVIYDLMAVLCPGGPLKMLVEVALDQNQTIPGLLYDATISTPQPSSSAVGTGTGTGTLQSPEATANTAAAVGDVEASPLLMNEAVQPDSEAVDSAQVGMSEVAEVEASPLLSDDAAPSNRTELASIPQAQEPPIPRDDDDESIADSEGVESLKLGLGDFVFYSVLVARAANLDITVTASCFLAVITGLCSTLFLLAIAGKALPALPISLTLGISFYFLCVGFVRHAVGDVVGAAVIV